MWANEKELKDFLNNNNYSISDTGNGRWIDQKCTPDVMSIVSDCIIDFVEKNQDQEYFTTVEVWNSEFANKIIVDYFSKPSLDDKKARNEYDKFFQQPAELLAHANILERKKVNNRNFYKINNYRILKFISISERNSLIFLINYIKKTLKDSNVYHLFNRFFNEQDVRTFTELKDGYVAFINEHTPIKGELEPRRIFTKVLNPLAFYFKKSGTHRGRMSKHNITMEMLMYNRENFRDINVEKPKNVSRQEFNEELVKNTKSAGYQRYLIEKAKRNVKLYNETYNNAVSEVFEEQHQNDIATHQHHIFPQHEFPEISHYPENLISLTPTQHLNYAHPLGNTYRIDYDYQQICLIVKSGTIEKSYDLGTTLYDFDDFITVLEVGHNDDTYRLISNKDFDNVRIKINQHYINQI